MSLKKIISSCSIEKLKWACSLDWILIANAIDSKEQKALIDVILSFYGSHILESERFRGLLLEALPERTIISLASMYTKKVLPNVNTNIRNLSNIRWTFKSPLIPIFKDILGIEGIYFPGMPIKITAVEELNTFSFLPPLFEYQKDVIDESLSFIANDAGRFMIQLQRE